MIIDRSARYREAQYRAGAGLAFGILTLLLTIEFRWMPWGWHAFNAGWLLLTIAAAYGVTRAALLRANPQVTDPSLIHPGDVLVIPRLGTEP